MDVIRLHAESFLRLRSGQASVISDATQLATFHSHDYYEIFLVSQGTATHNVNGVTQTLEPGMLYFMRPNDIHGYLTPSSQFQIINILIPNTVFQLFLDFVGDSYYMQRLLSPILPPFTVLARGEQENLMETMRQLLIRGKIMKSESDTLFRIAIFNLLTTHFPVLPKKNTVSIPDWLKIVHIEMLKKPNFTEGLPAVYRLAGKSVEHVSRACRKYMNKTPTQIVNEIRLEYAARCIIQTKLEIVEVCSDAGFESVSHFYHLFRAYFGISPRRFRKCANNLSLQEHLFQGLETNDSRLEKALPLQKVMRSSL